MNKKEAFISITKYFRGILFNNKYQMRTLYQTEAALVYHQKLLLLSMHLFFAEAQYPSALVYILIALYFFAYYINIKILFPRYGICVFYSDARNYQCNSYHFFNFFSGIITC